MKLVQFYKNGGLEVNEEGLVKAFKLEDIDFVEDCFDEGCKRVVIDVEPKDIVKWDSFYVDSIRVAYIQPQDITVRYGMEELGIE